MVSLRFLPFLSHCAKDMLHFPHRGLLLRVNDRLQPATQGSRWREVKKDPEETHPNGLLGCTKQHCTFISGLNFVLSCNNVKNDPF